MTTVCVMAPNIAMSVEAVLEWGCIGGDEGKIRRIKCAYCAGFISSRTISKWGREKRKEKERMIQMDWKQDQQFDW